MSRAEPDWKSIALYLADCHAATAEYDGALSSTSKTRRERFASICEKALAAIRSGALPDERGTIRVDQARIENRLEGAIRSNTPRGDARGA